MTFSISLLTKSWLFTIWGPGQIVLLERCLNVFDIQNREELYVYLIYLDVKVITKMLFLPDPFLCNHLYGMLVLSIHKYMPRNCASTAKQKVQLADSFSMH